MFIPPLRLSTPVNSVEVVRFRRDVAEPRAVAPVSRVEIASEQAAILHLGSQARSLALGRRPDDPERDSASARQGDAAASGEDDPDATLTEEEQRHVEQLRQRDREVRTHEQAHKTLGGQHAGNIHLEYEVGADGKRYAVSGSVPIDSSPVDGDPAATLRKMETVRRAANAPGNPSSADRQVAAQAAELALRARAELAAERYTKAERYAQAERSGADGSPANDVAGRGSPESTQGPSEPRLAVFA